MPLFYTPPYYGPWLSPYPIWLPLSRHVRIPLSWRSPSQFSQKKPSEFGLEERSDLIWCRSTLVLIGIRVLFRAGEIDHYGALREAVCVRG